MKNYLVYFRGVVLFNATIEAFSNLTKKEVLSKYNTVSNNLKPKVTKNLNRIQLFEWQGNCAFTIETRELG